jgi:exopolysaccharide biosynthesis polyprenyl glycosylphosphotransferase
MTSLADGFDVISSDDARGVLLGSEAGAVRRTVPAWKSKSVLIASDVAAISLAMAAAFVLRRFFPGDPKAIPTSEHAYLGAASLPVWIVLFSRYRLYSARFTASRLDESGRIAHACGACVGLMTVVSYMLKMEVARGWLLLTMMLAFASVSSEREVLRRLFDRLRRAGRLRRPIVIVGTNDEARALESMLTNSPALGYSVVGFVDDNVSIGTAIASGRTVIGGLSDIADVVREANATGVMIATTALDLGTSNRLARQLLDAGIHVEMSAGLRDIAAERLTVRPLGRFPVMYLEPVRRTGWRSAAKRAFDVSTAAAVLLASIPVMVMAAIAIKLTSRGPVFFGQARVGRDGVPFRVLKFRTMVVDAEQLLVDLRAQNEADGPLFKMKHDPRVTSVGRVLRRLSIDELPQLLNVIRGDMSVVGPRPALAKELVEWSPEVHNRLRVKPGITGMWQVHGRSNASFDEYVRLDLYYVDNWSLLTDLAIVAKTVPTVLLSRGAY